MRVLFVCMGNTCRSPMLKIMIDDYLAKHGEKQIAVDSAGILKQCKPISEKTVKVLEAHGIAFDKNHLSKYCDKSLVHDADFVICVTEECAQLLKKQYPSSHSIISLLELIGENIPDPYGKGIAEYEKTYAKLKKALPQIYSYIQK